jgi:glucosamine 6-phosphate synthetase-like amidotransferase/phosphosugar isomerase protein
MTQSASEVAQGPWVAAIEEAITRQPDAVSETITSNFDGIRAAAALVAAGRRVRLCGVGPGMEVAFIAEHMLRSIGIDARAANAYDLAVYPANFDPGDLFIGVFQGNDKTWPARVLQRAIHAGLKTVAVGPREGVPHGSEVTIETIEQERLPIQPGAFTAVLAVLAATAARFEPRSPLAAAVPGLREIIRSTLGSRDTAREVAAMVAALEPRLLIVGAAADAGVARAAAGMVRRLALLPAEALHLEDAIASHLAGLRAGDLLVQIAPAGPSEERFAELARIAEEAEVNCWRIGASGTGCRWQTPLPVVPEVVTPIASIVPLQWLALECAIARGIQIDHDSEGALPAL